MCWFRGRDPLLGGWKEGREPSTWTTQSGGPPLAQALPGSSTLDTVNTHNPHQPSINIPIAKTSSCISIM